MLAFNKTDWVSTGWNFHLEGFTIFIRLETEHLIRALKLIFSTEHEEFLDEGNSILLNDVTRGIPVVNLKQVREKKLGSPYSGRFR